MILLNFAHPLTGQRRHRDAAATGRRYEMSLRERSHIRTVALASPCQGHNGDKWAV